MKRFLVVLAVAAVAGATYVATASSSQTAAAPTARQFAALKRQVSLLSKKVKTQGVKIGALQTAEKGVKTEADDVVGFLNSCFFSTNAGALPINQFGDPGGTLGYHYQQSTTAGDDVLTSALDVDSSSTPGAFVQVVDPTCVTPSGGLRKMGALADHRAAIHAVAKH